MVAPSLEMVTRPCAARREWVEQFGGLEAHATRRTAPPQQPATTSGLSIQIKMLASPPRLVVMNELVHASRAERGAHSVSKRHARVDIGDQLRRALAGIGTLFEKNDLRLLRSGQRRVQVRRAKVKQIESPGLRTGCC